jgi:iron complex outermembrane receptor protein
MIAMPSPAFILRGARAAAAIAGLSGAAALGGAAAQAQPSPSGAPAPAVVLPEVRVSADPLGADLLRATRPVGLLLSPELERALDTSLGATLAGQPGVHTSGFGTAAGRPVIRGQDGARVRITQNGLDTLDVSALSPDHAVAIDPLTADRIEILRGPATLPFGGGAVGGLVNVVSERIPLSRQDALGGRLIASTDSATGGHSAGFSLKAGSRGLNWTLGAFDRQAGEYRIPGLATAGDPDSRTRRLPNSQARGDGYSGGVSWIGDRVVLGAAHSALGSRYGIPTEADVFIRMRQQRSEALAQIEEPLPGLTRLKLTLAEGRYRHEEVEGAGEVGTAFAVRGREGRLELAHAPLGGLRGVLGAQLRERTLQARGEEAYVPGSRDRNDGLFYVAERPIGAARLEMGWRGERASLRPEEASGLPSRRFALNALSAGLSAPVASGYRIAANLGSAQRAPALEELYAQGAHAATATWEIGNPALRPERSINLDLSVRRTAGALRWKAGAFANRYANYLYGKATDENGDGLADRVDAENALANSATDPGAGEYARIAYAQGHARFVGLEAEIDWRPAGSPWSLRAFGDLARGRIEGEGNVPRMAPARIGAALDWASGPWSGFVSVLSVGGQRRVAAFETTSPGYTRIDAEIALRLGTVPGAPTLFVQGRNLLDETIRPHTSFVKDRVPMPGRSVLAGVRARF